MDLREYIKKHYKNPNVQILQLLGADESLIDYLLYTPWNTNMNIVDQLNSSESGGWTTIRLEKIYNSEFEYYLLGSHDAEAVAAFEALADLEQAGENPIIKIDYHITNNGTVITNSTYFCQLYINEGVQRDISLSTYEPEPFMDITKGVDGTTDYLSTGIEDPSDSDYIEISYKVGKFYTVSIGKLYQNSSGKITLNDFRVEQNSSYIVPDLDGYILSNTTNKYYKNDKLIFNSDKEFLITKPYNIFIETSFGTELQANLPLNENGRYDRNSLLKVGEADKTEDGISIYTNPSEVWYKKGPGYGTLQLNYIELGQQYYSCVDF